MKEQIKQIQGLIDGYQAVTPRTSYLDVAQGALSTALANTQQHLAEMGRQAEARAKQLADDQAALKKLQDQVAADQAAASAAAAAVNN